MICSLSGSDMVRKTFILPLGQWLLLGPDGGNDSIGVLCPTNNLVDESYSSFRHMLCLRSQV